jgi:hypothetical protein
LIPTEWQEVARAIHGSGYQLVIAVTGGGTGALSALLQTPGASRSVLEAVVPYSLASLIDWIGGEPDQACSKATARAMAMAAFMRARELAPGADVAKLIGVGCTASLATDRPKRGQRRGHLAFQRFDRTYEARFTLDELPPSRAADEQIAAEQLLATVAEACQLSEAASKLRSSIGHGVLAADEDVELLLGDKRVVVRGPGRWWDYLDENAVSSIQLVLPGAFNPPHAGHLAMAKLAERRIQCDAVWELSIENVDKPPLDYISIDERFEWLRDVDDKRWIALTRAPTFREKADLFPGATFVVGVDTMLRIAEPRYYGGDFAKRDEAVGEMARNGCRFLVFGRVIGGRFQTLSDLNLPAELRSLCEEVPASEFREDVSSTELRAKADV